MSEGKLLEHNANLVMATLNNEPMELSELNRRKFDIFD